MLVLSRKVLEQILIGDSVTITVIRIGPNTVRLGIDAPREMNIVRRELADAMQHIDLDLSSRGTHDDRNPRLQTATSEPLPGQHVD